MSEPRLRQILSLIDSALEVFRSAPEDSLNVAELKGKLSLLEARRQLADYIRLVTKSDAHRFD